MNNFEYLSSLVRDHLDGDKSRLPELFEENKLFLELQARGRDSDWYHFQPKTYDGCYFVQGSSGYEVYEQERGTKSDRMVFASLPEAARHYFKSYW